MITIGSQKQLLRAQPNRPDKTPTKALEVSSFSGISARNKRIGIFQLSKSNDNHTDKHN